MWTSDGAAAAALRYALGRFGPRVAVAALAGDASTRRYFRLTPHGTPPAILAVYPPPAAGAIKTTLAATRLLATIGVAVPAVLDTDLRHGVMLLADCGDRLLQGVLTGGGGEPALVGPEADGLYRQAVDLIAVLQQRGTPRLHGGMAAGRQALDAVRLQYELDYFFQHLVLGLRGLRPTASQRAAVERAFACLALELDAEPRVLCHRDYHARNLMVDRRLRLTVIDHQDARLGPDTYDLASLLCDPYVHVPGERRSAMLYRFREKTAPGEDHGAFVGRFHRMAVQRTLKAAGTFAAQKQLRGRETYLPYLPRVLETARLSMAAAPGLEELQAALAPLVPELAGPVESTTGRGGSAPGGAPPGAGRL